MSRWGKLEIWRLNRKCTAGLPANKQCTEENQLSEGLGNWNIYK